ncbi:hypothetical protein O181_049020 [Austropuccinia psidii MF-1]|uniref:DUF4939 domain-containing protein n=1 Tax=Austropuccinia psidii MF-1 TaxID=1389203 RepID=A0A9Q3HPP1_9BASI|nr:hypothetical protein [Austropuccinia psidii MF-1]
MANLDNDYGYGQIAIYWIWHGYAILRSKRVNFHGCDKSEPSLLAIMQQMTQVMANLQVASSSESSRPPAFKTPSMKTPECFDGTHPFKVRSFIQSCQLIFHNYLANFSQDRKEVLYATSFLIGRASKWIEPYLSNLTNKDPRYLLILGHYLNLNYLLCLGTQRKSGKLRLSWIPYE